MTTDNTNPLSGISHNNLPRMIFHGFVAKRDDRTTVPTDTQLAATGHLQEYIASLPPLYRETEDLETADGEVIGQVGRSGEAAVNAGYLGLDILDGDKEYFRTDLDAALDLTKFMTSCAWETMTTIPYANATVGLRMPLQLAHYLFHGESADLFSPGGANPSRPAFRVGASGFRYIEAGGWVSIRFPYLWKDDVGGKSGSEYRTVFFGKVLAINMKAVVDTDSIFNCAVTLTLGSFIQPLTTGESRKTYRRLDKIAEIDPAAMGSYSTENNIILKALVRQLRDMRSGERGVDMYDSLRYMIKSLGHMELPTDLCPRKGALNRAQRLGDNIYVMGEYQDTTVNTIYAINAADINTVIGRPEERYFTASFMSQQTTCWGIIQSMFQPSTELIELFPVIIPLDPTGNALARGSGGGGEHVATSEGTISSEGQWRNTDLVNGLKSVLYIMYRYKPMPPNFYGDARAVNAANLRSKGVRDRVEGKTNHETFFGTHDTQVTQRVFNDDPEIRRRLKAGESVQMTPENTHVEIVGNNWNPEFVYVNEDQIISIDLTWSDLNRVNAVNMSLPFAEGSTGADNLFGVECIPVFNQHDINRNGLRMRNLHTPFASNATAEHIRNFNRNASSGMAERLYYLVGEGHAYAEGAIQLVYTPNPNLTAGIWCASHFKADLGRGNDLNFIVGSGGAEAVNQSKPLTYYVTSVKHEISIEPETGAPSGTTTLTVERASFGNRIPAISLNQVTRQTPPAPPRDESRTQRRPARRRRRRR